MDQIKIGKFIQGKRKEKGLTQSDLAEKLNITDRAISKWENGICLPDAGTMPLLCEILCISINDLFSGEKVDMKNNEKKLEENLLEMTKLKENKDKELLTMEIVIGVLSSLVLFVLVFVASFVDMPDYVRIILIVTGIIPFAIGISYAIRIEQVAGYYECNECHHKYVPKYSSVLFAMHVNRTRYMKCPKCGRKSWQKKVLK
ncbi:MAG: helix-turn-helix domain-containing protein [Bacilli bacterium]|nr:helix-turn-helix domain-containing protein [Bacilli bacterium]